MSNEHTATRPRWWKITLISPWLAHTLEFFAVMMLLAFPLAAETPHTVTRWAIFATALFFSLTYGAYASHRIRQTIVSSDETSYTVRLEWLRRGTQLPPQS